ncbi:MAG: carboxypeptidase-like regulatory domain-containing protein [Armatimonadota bacterium]
MGRLALLVGIGAVALTGCGGGTGPIFNAPGDVAPLASDPAGTLLTPPTVDDGLIARWLDVEDTAYTTGRDGVTPFTASFDYADASVMATWTTPAEQLVVTLTGTGLKPNFAYQIKLEGLPAVDPEGNQILADLGRSWEGRGYLIAGYFVTDESGTIARTASSQWWPSTATPIDSSYHVLWKTSQRTPLRFDGPVITHTVQQTSWGYDGNAAGGTVGVYGEWEAKRPKPGKLILPDHAYTCLLRLSEEAFHMRDSSGNLIYGWKSVLDAPVQFTIGASAGPSATGSIAGTVRYSSGTPARRVEVKLTDETTGSIIKRTKTGGNGSYSFGDVPADSTYTVSALSASVSGVVVVANQTTTVDLVVP